MKSVIRVAVCILVLLVGTMAQAATSYIGTCQSKLGTIGQSKTGSGTISVAVIVPPSEYKGLDGASITGLRFGLMTTAGISNVKVWLRRELTGENVAEVAVTKPTKGWNEVSLAAPIALHATDTLVLGYDFDQSESVKCISIAGDVQDNGYWVAKNGSWQNRSKSVDGSVSVEARVEGEEVPMVNLAIESSSYDRITPYGADYHALVVVRNMGQKKVEGYTLALDINGQYSDVSTVSHTLRTNDRDTLRIRFASDVVAQGTLIPVRVRISAAGDEVEADDTVTLPLSSYTETVPHKVLVEEFSTEKCGNCPRAHNTLRNCLDAGLGDRMVIVTHHVGYGTDWLTVEEDKAYLWFYGDEGTFAPAGMFDRTNLPEYHANGSGSDDTSVPVFSIGLVDTFRPALEYAISQPAFVTIVPTVSYDVATRGLTLDVVAEKLETLDALTAEPRLSVYLVEDSILAHNQAGVSSTTYRHRHTNRKCLTDVWGDPIAFDDARRAEASYTCTLPEEWDEHYVEAVFLISNYNPADRNDCNVLNAEQAAVCPVAAGIGQVAMGTMATTRYNLYGQRVQAATSGFCLDNGKKRFVR